MPAKKWRLWLRFTIAAAILLPVAAAGEPIRSLNLMPVPEQVALNPGRLRIGSGFTARLSGHQDPLLVMAMDRLRGRLQAKTGIPFDTIPEDPGSKQAVMQIHCSGPGEPVQSPAADESYRLAVTDQGARLEAPSPIGILRGIETFLQLIDLDGQSFFVPCVEVTDRPRFRWRGLHIDVSRHWQPPEIIRRNLDAMAAVKMNVFHWHLSDDQGFRVESRKHPKLHQMGSDGKYYTQSEVRAIVEYARQRGIRVIPEFDMPGHSSSWLVGYPELASAPGPYRIERSWGAFEACLDPTREATYVFLDAFVGEMAGLFPDESFHIGGDEVDPKQWNANPKIRAFIKKNGFKDSRGLQAYFSRRMQKILAKHGKVMIGWDEILHPDLPKSTLVQLWRRQPSPAELAGKGYAGILSRGYYLDAMEPASFHYGIDPMGQEADALNSDERSRILGGEACMWAEFVDAQNIESRIWPRAAAIAERLWSPPGVADVEDMYRRLNSLSRELERLGLRHRTNYAAMIRRMAANGDAALLKKLADLVIPTRLGIRQRSQSYTSFTPLNRMVDAVPPESETARRFDQSVKLLLSNPSNAGVIRQVREALTGWIEDEKQARPIMEQSYLLTEIRPISETISELCLKGLQALDYLESRQSAPEAWRKETSALLDRAGKPQAEMLPAITASIKRLVEAVD